MWLSKIWFALVCFVAAGAVAFGHLVFQASTRQTEREQAERLDRAQDGAHLLLKINIRSWIDEASRLSGDAILLDGAEQFARTEGPDGPDAPLVHDTVQTRLRTFNDKLQADLVVAVDARGKVVARAGLDENVYGDGLVGYPLVRAVLRGYLRDDAWVLGGRLYRMAGAPIANSTRRRIVGGLLVGKEVDDTFAASLKERLGTDVAFFLDGHVVAKSLASPVLYRIPSLIEENAAVLRDKGRTPALRVDSEGAAYHGVLAPVVGEAAEVGACYALLVERRTATGLAGLFRRIGRDDVAWGAFPWWFVVGGLVLALVVGVLLMGFEVDAPLRRLVDESRDVAKGVSGKVNDAILRGKFGTIGRAINETIERLGKARPTRPDIGRMFGGTPAGAEAPTVPMVPFGVNPPQGRPAPVPPAPPAAVGPPGPSPAAGMPQRMAGTIIGTGPVHGLAPGAPQGEPTPGGVAPARTPVPLKPRSPLPGPVIAMTPRTPVPRKPRSPLPGPVSAMTPRTPVPLKPRSPLPGPTASMTPGTPLPFKVQSPVPGPTPRVTTPRTPVPTLGDPSLLQEESAGDETDGEAKFEESVRKVYEEFNEAKRRCGETDSIPFDRFAAKLRSNREQIISRYNCKEVRFAVYVKDGKAAVKASPVRG